jgi:acyl carrier protein
MTSYTPWINELIAAPASERGNLLEFCVVTEFRQWLQMGATDLLPLDESYFALGLSSLGAVEIQQQLEAKLGCRIDSASLYNNPTVGHLVAYLRAEPLAEFFTSAQATSKIQLNNANSFNNKAQPNNQDSSSVVRNEHLSSKQILDDILNDLYEA